MSQDAHFHSAETLGLSLGSIINYSFRVKRKSKKKAKTRWTTAVVSNSATLGLCTVRAKVCLRVCMWATLILGGLAQHCAGTRGCAGRDKTKRLRRTASKMGKWGKSMRDWRACRRAVYSSDEPNLRTRRGPRGLDGHLYLVVDPIYGPRPLRRIGTYRNIATELERLVKPRCASLQHDEPVGAANPSGFSCGPVCLCAAVGAAQR